MVLVHALICCSAVLSWMQDSAEGHELLAGILLPISGPWPVDRSLESVVNSSVREINHYLTSRRVPYGNISTLDVSVVGVQCDPVATVKAILELALDRNRTVDVFIGERRNKYWSYRNNTATRILWIMARIDHEQKYVAIDEIILHVLCLYYNYIGLRRFIFVIIVVVCIYLFIYS